MTPLLPISDGSRTFTYDRHNRLISISQGTETLAEYAYDFLGRRVKKTVGGMTTYYVYDANNNLIAETDGNGTPLRDYIYLGSEPVAMKVYGAQAGIYYFINDHLGTPQKIVDSSGTMVWEAAYLPFGQAQMLVANITNNLRFPGQYFDSETGLHYNWHRYYDPQTGRYLTPDPIGLAGGDVNLYSYTSNNPVNYIDPDGRFAIAIPPAALALATATSYVTAGLAGTSIGQWIWDNWFANESNEGFCNLTDDKAKKHILDSDDSGGGHRSGTGAPGKSEFPPDWSDEDILDAISDVATDPASKVTPSRGGRTILDGTRKGVDVRVIVESPNKGGRIV